MNGLLFRLLLSISREHPPLSALLETMAPSAVSPAPDPAGCIASLTTTYDDTLRFYLNGTRVVLDEIDPEVTLLEYLRGIGLTGTKL